MSDTTDGLSSAAQVSASVPWPMPAAQEGRAGESMKTRLMRWGFNLWPCLRGSGGRITYIARDMREIHVKVGLSWRTRNYVGTIYGGSMFGITDPMYMVMLIKLLGPKYFVVDKAGSIRYLKPGRDSLFARFLVSEAETEAIRQELEQREQLDREYTVDLVDAQGTVHAVVKRTLHFRKRRNKTAGSSPA